MKVLIVNSRYFPSAGPEKYLFSISRVLTERGHQVIPFSLKNSRNVPSPYADRFAENIGGGDELFFEEMDTSLSTRLQLLDRQFYSFPVRRQLEVLIRETRPDVGYVLHHQNRLSPSVIDACKRQHVPVVVRISDFSLVCTRNNLLRDGDVCELCLTKGISQGIKYRCVKDSIVASAVKAAALAFYRLSRIYTKANRIVVPSRFTMGKLGSILDPEKMVYLPTLEVCDRPYDSGVGDYALFVGRVEEEKGLIHAIKAFERTHYPFRIAGYSHTGYGERLGEYVRSRGISNVEFLGPKYGDELDELYRNCRFVVLPVIWYENLPNVALEAMSYSKPVVCSDIGSMREVVQHEHTGLRFETGNSDACLEAIHRLIASDDLVRALGAAAYDRVTEYYSAAKHYDGLMRIFAEIGGASLGAGAR